MLKDKYKESLQFSTESWCGQKCSWWWLSPPGPSMTGSTATSFTGTPSLLKRFWSWIKYFLQHLSWDFFLRLRFHHHNLVGLPLEEKAALVPTFEGQLVPLANIFITWDPLVTPLLFECSLSWINIWSDQFYYQTANLDTFCIQRIFGFCCFQTLLEKVGRLED